MKKLILFLAIVLLPIPLVAASITLQWTASPDADVTGYKAYLGIDQLNLSTVIDVGNVTTVEIQNLQAGQFYYVRLKAYDATGAESPFSNWAYGEAKLKPASDLSIEE
jgi:hypothetical protein